MRFPRMPPRSKIMEAVQLTRDTQMGRSTFLNDEDNAEKLVKFAGLTNNDHVCELGAGFGVLSTQILKEKVKSLFSVEWNRICIDHLAKFPKYHKHHTIKYGDPFFMDFTHEYEFMRHDSNPNLTIFVSSPTNPRNFFFVDQFVEDLVYKQQLFSFPKLNLKIITLIEANKAQRICGNDTIPGSIHDLLPQNYFSVELGPKLQQNVFTVAANSPCHVLKLIPLPKPRLDVDYDFLKQVLIYLSGPEYTKFSKRQVKENLMYHGILNSNNESQFYEICNTHDFDLNTEQKDLSFIDVIKFTNVLHILSKS